MADELYLATPGGNVSELWARPFWRVVALFVGSAVAGVLGGVLWSLITPRSTYTVQENLVASISERGQAQVFASDATFVIISAVIGLAIGILGWAALYRRGWLVTFMPVLAAFGAGLIVWQVGLLIGEGNFDQALAGANPGDVVPIDLTLRSLSALLVTPFAAVTPIMLLSAFWPEPRPEQAEGDPVEAH